MCVAVPMKIVERTGDDAVAEQDGVRRRIRVDFLPDVAVGAYVLVHAGIAIEVVDEAQAEETLRGLRLLLEGEPDQSGR